MKNDPERVLVLITKLDRGGAETMLMNYYRHFDRTKLQYDFLVNREEPGAYEEEIKALGGRIYRMCPMYPQYFHRYKKEFREFLMDHPEYRIIHSNLEERSYFPLRIAKEMKIPVRIAHAHNEYRNFDMKTPMRDYFRFRLPPFITHAFACSVGAGQWLYGSKRIRHSEVTIVPNAIDPELYTFHEERRKVMRQKLRIDDRIVIGNVGRLTTQKNQSFLIEIYERIRYRFPRSVLMLVGFGDDEKNLKELVSSKGLENNVIFTGSVSNVSDYLQAMDIFVFPSLYEGLGMSLIEAQATGLQCIAADVVPRAADITGNVKFVSLHRTAQEWAQVAADTIAANTVRSGHIKELRDAQFDIDCEAIKLEKFYLDISRKI